MNDASTSMSSLIPLWGDFPFWAALVLGVLSGIFGLVTFSRSSVPKVTFIGYGVLFLGWTSLMVYVGVVQESCPIHGVGQAFVFLAWALLLFYLLAGPAYRLSFLGGLTGVAALVLACLAASFGIEPAGSRSGFRVDLHVGLAMLAYAAFALSAITSVALLVQNRHLKKHELEGTYRKLPKLNLLGKASPQLVIVGIILLTVSMGLILPDYHSVPWPKLIAASATWTGYVALAVVAKWRGMPPQWFAWWNAAIFLMALTVIFLSR